MGNSPIFEDIKRKQAEEYFKSLPTCKYCGAKFIPSKTATVKDECHACIMAGM